MITNLPDTDTANIACQLIQLREQGGIATTGHILILIVLVKSEDGLENIISTVNFVSHGHPPRVLVLVSDNSRLDNRPDAELRVGGGVDAAETVVMYMSDEIGQYHDPVMTPLLLPDTPVVAQWPSEAPQVPAVTPIGRVAQCRITGSLCDPSSNVIYVRYTSYTPGDSDLSWSRLTNWHDALASAPDLPSHSPVTSVSIYGPKESPPVGVAAGRLADRLGLSADRYSTGEKKISVGEKNRAKLPMTSVVFECENGQILRIDIESATTALVINGEKLPFRVALSHPTRSECLTEELRYSNYNTAYGRVLCGLSQIHTVGIQPPTSITTSFANELGVSDK